MGRSQETFNKKEVKKKQEKKRKQKAEKRLARKESDAKTSMDDMIAYVDEHGMISTTPPDPGKKSKIKSDDIEISVPKRSAEDQQTERTGVLTFFNEGKGFGFIKDSESKQDVFVHINNMQGEIKEGNKVSFELTRGQKGNAAINVKLIAE
jgi:cold shock CspA family protein